MNEIDQLEQELSELRRRFAQSAGVLEELAQVKVQFSELSQTHQSLQNSLEKVKQLLDAPMPSEAVLEPRLSQLESQFEIRCEQLQAQLTNFRFDFDAVNRQLYEKLEQSDRQLEKLETDQAKTLTADEGDRLKWLESSLQNLNTSMYEDRSNWQKLERRYSHLKRTVDIIQVTGMVGFVLVALVFLLMPR